MKFLLLSIALLLSTQLSFGQELTPDEQDMVIFKNHSQLKGEIIEISKRWVVIKVGNAPFTINKNRISGVYYQGEVISFLDLDMEGLEQLAEKERRKNGESTEIPGNPGYRLVPVKEPAKRGFYNVAYATLHFRNGGDFENHEFSFGVSNTFGYQINKYTGLGIGVGYFDNQRFSNGGSIVPIFAEYRGYLSDKKVSAYYSLAYGVSFATNNKDNNIQSTSPGSYFYPAVGFKSGSKEASFMVDVGLRFSRVSYTFRSNFSNTILEETDFSRGLILRIGVML